MGKSCLLVGAGAEVGLGLPSGPKFLLDTYFTKKPTMYEALRGFTNLNARCRREYRTIEPSTSLLPNPGRFIR